MGVVLALPVGLKAATLAPAGTTFVVTSTADAVDANLANPACAAASGACTLRAAIQQANALAGADVVQVPAGTYALALRPVNQNLAETGDLDITAPLTLVGAGPQATILDGGTPSGNAPEIRGLDRLLEIHAGAGDVSLRGLTVREGYNSEQGGGLYNVSGGRLRLEDVRVLGSYAAKYGGGIANAGAGRIELVGSTVSGNGAKEGGAAIHNAVAGTVSITAGSAIVDNPGGSASALDDYPVTGGAINNEGDGDTIGTIEVLDSTVARNEASSNGAGIHNERDGRVVVLRSVVTGNRTSSSGGGIYSNSGTVLIAEGTVVSDNHAGSDISSGSGGGIYNAGQMSKAGTPGRLQIANATIEGNTATADGAGVHCGLDAELAISDSRISDNAAAGEGGGVSVQAKADMSVARTTFADNSAEVAGGGAYVYAEGIASFADATFTDNRAGETGGGGLLTDGSGSVSVVRSTFLRNRAVGDGGGLLVSSGGEQSITDSLVGDNHSDEGGGGIFNSGMVVTFERLRIAGNTALVDGGGIKSEGSGQFTILDSTIEGNTAENGGAFTNAADGTLSVFGSTISGNTARGDGGGYLEIGDADSQIENSTLAGNRAGDRGGGLYTNADATLRVINVTITNNMARSGSGLSTSVESLNFPVIPATAVILRNTIVAGNHDGINCHGAVFSEGGNLDDGTTCFFSDPSDLTRAGASVEPLAANGGPTRTHALKPTSVAIDRGVSPCPDVDQRGVPRPKNSGCDIGAFEFEGTPGQPDSDPLPPPTGPDSDPPSVTLDAKPPARTLDTFAEFRFRADELARFECVLDPATGASFSGCESPHDYTNLALGLHTVQIRAIDAASNVGQPQTYSWRVVVELDPPETSITGGPSGATNSRNASVAFAADEPASFECSLDGAEYAVCTSPLALTALADGSHILEVRAIDDSFNVDESPASRSWTVDGTPPDTAIDSGPEGLTNDATPTFALSATETDVSFLCRLDAGALGACASPFTTPALADGAHTLEVRATDAAGNTDASPASRSFTVDTLAPETAIDADPGDLTNDVTPRFEFSSEAGASFECRVDTGAFADCGSPHDTAELSEGAHTFEARATDAAGNTDASAASHSFAVDTIAPVTTIASGPSSLTRSTSATIAFSASEDATFSCSLDGADYAGCGSPLELTELGDGEHTLQARATDAAGNEGDPATHGWTVDTTPPDTAIDSGPAGPTNDTTPTFTFSSEEDATFECALDAADFAACISPVTVHALGEGVHTFRVRAIDLAGNVDPAPASRELAVDTTAPDTAIAAGPTGPTNDATPIFELTSEVGASFECRVDTSDFAECSSPHTTAELSDGEHAFEVRARDAAGNVDATPVSRSFTVDTLAPETAIDSGPSGLTASSDATLSFSANEAASFECRLDAGDFASCTSPQLLNALAEGEHTFQVRASDAAANADGSPASRTWTVDTTPPETTFDSGPSGPTSDATPTFGFSSEAGASFECRVDSAPFAACESPATTAVLADGAHTFEVRARDTAGNVDGTPALRDFTVDTSPPDTAIDSGPSGLTADSTPTFAFSSESSAGFECRVDTGEFAECGSPFTTAVLGDGAHSFDVRARDGAGNLDTTPAGRAFTVDASAPDTTIDSGPSGPTNDATPTFGFSSEAGASFECRVDAGEFADCSSPYTTETLAEGAHSFDVRAADAAGNADASPASRSFTVDTVAPETTIDDGPPATTTSTSASFSFSATEAATFECALDGGSFAACTSPEEYTGLAVAAHQFRVRAKDAAGNTDTSPAARAWTVEAPDTAAPVVTLTGPAAETTETTARFEFSANEPVTGFRCALDGATPAACSSPVDLADITLGPHTFRVETTDLAGNAVAETHTWEVKMAPDTTAPFVTIGGPPDSTPSTSATFTFTADEPATFRCSLDSAPFAECTSPTSYSGLGVGQHLFRVEATDGATNQSITGFTWTVVDSSAPIVTISRGPVSPTTSTTATFEFSANEPVTFHCSRDQGAFAVCSSPITYSGLAVGQHSFEVRATDSASLVGAASYVWTISPAQDTTTPVVTISSGPASGTSSTSATFRFSASEPVGFQCSLDGGALQVCETGVSYSGLAVGPHTFQLQGRDAAGNMGSASWGWTISGSQPSCTPQTFTVAPNADSWLLQSSASSNYGQDSVVKVDTKSGANARAIVRFPLPTIPAGCGVQSAQLRLYAGSYKTGRTLQAVPVGSSWSESSVTWDNQPAASASFVNAPSSSGYVVWNVASLVSGATGNFSFVIRDASENGQGVEQGFNSREKGTDNPPRLVITVG